MNWIVVSLLSLLIVAQSHSSYAGRTVDSDLPCKHFDSLQDKNVCKYVNRGRQVEIAPEGEYRHLYRAAYRQLNKTKERKFAIQYLSGTITFEGWMIDLDNDGVEEAILIPTDSVFRGAQGNGDILIFKLAKGNKGMNKWYLIGNVQGNALHVEKGKSSGYHNLMVHWHMGVESLFTWYKFNNRDNRYVAAKRGTFSCTPSSLESCFRPNKQP